MTEKNDPRTHLVAETFHDDWATGPASAMARRAAAHARRRRLVKQLALPGAAALAIALAGLVFFTNRVNNAVSSPIASAPPLPVSPLPAPTAPVLLSKVAIPFEIISDEELFAELRGRPVLELPQEHGARRVVVLSR